MRRGVSILAVVILFSAIAAVLVLAYHTLWRGSSRTLFSVQERRLLVNLARSSLAEAYFDLQRSADEGRARWFDWFTAPAAPAGRTFVPGTTRQNAALMSADETVLAYRTSDVQLSRVVGLDRSDPESGAQGVLDLRVEVEVTRTAPHHTARLVMVERRTFRFQNRTGPFRYAGAHVELSPTPLATLLEGP